MKYQVPQFIEVEDKIFGPLTLKQFLYVAGGVATGFIFWTIFPRVIAILLGIPIVIFFFSMAFYKYNGRNFVYTVESAAKYFLTNKIYIWKKTPKAITKKEGLPKEKLELEIPKLSDSKLKELTWSLDVNEKLK